MMPRHTIRLLVLSLLGSPPSWSYPLDGDEYTGIARLEGYRLAHSGKVWGPRQPIGALLPSERVDLRLFKAPELTLPDPDPTFTAQVERLLGEDLDHYGLAVLDLTDPETPHYAEVNAGKRHTPGSLGKLLVALGVFQALAEIYPDNIAARERVLRESRVVADGFIINDHHKVPLWSPDTMELSWRPLQLGDKASLWTYLDWMLSASSNAAASMVMKHLGLLVHYGRRYPVSEVEADRLFRNTPKSELAQLLQRALTEPVSRNGLDLNQIRQGSFFTPEGVRRVPGTSNYANARELLRFLLYLEQGKLVDDFSSREIKRLLYMTQRRIRYASSRALNSAAVYFKSGSFYRCRPDPRSLCRKYQGNLQNLMSSAAIVEAPRNSPKIHYLVSVMSNVLGKNSAQEHETLATRLHRLIEDRHRPAEPPESELTQRSDHPTRR